MERLINDHNQSETFKSFYCFSLNYYFLKISFGVSQRFGELMCPVDHDVSYVQSSRILHLTILKYGVSLYIFTLPPTGHYERN